MISKNEVAVMIWGMNEVRYECEACDEKTWCDLSLSTIFRSSALVAKLIITLGGGLLGLRRSVLLFILVLLVLGRR